MRLPTTGLVLAASLVLAACSGTDQATTEPVRTTRPGDVVATTTSLPPDDCQPARSLDDPPTEPQTFSFGGEVRTYLLSLPADYDGREAMPLVFNFHGFGSSKEGQEATTEMGSEGAARGFIVVTPDALGQIREFNMFGSPGMADDFGFVHALLADLEGRLCIEHDRVFAAGHSNGSAFTGFLGCKDPYEFAAVAMVAATIPSTCPKTETPSVLAIAGTADAQVPYDGGSVGGGPTLIPPAPETFDAYLKAYRCSPEPERSEPHPNVTRATGVDCRGGALVVLDTVRGGTHAWPGGAQARADASNSEAGRTYDATDEILSFFERS